MTGLAIKEKYPGSRRIDHPDFQDVYQTTFAKGVITDFQKVQDDPLAVQSLVKVQVEGLDESGYIPLFFNPKEQYWDDPEHEAQDFNEEGKYHEKAWMSFRGDDEVVVMLQKGVPVAVLGFADGIPRVGEDVIKIDNQVDDPYYLQCSRMTAEHYEETYPGQENGPDGKSLKLTEEAECILDTTQDLDQNTNAWNHLLNLELWQINSCTDGQPPFGMASLNYTDLTGEIRWRSMSKTSFIIRHHLVPVGPILYCFQVVWSSYQSGMEYDHNFPTNSATYDIAYASCADAAETAAGLQEIYDRVTAETPEGITWNDPSMDLICINVFAAVYLKKTYDDTKGAAGTPTVGEYYVCDDFKKEYPGFKFQTWFTEAMQQYMDEISSCDNIKFFMHPH